ncbi:MFS transporter, partial [Stieleria sp.]|uniref:MFS transporter n=1 Tax=Stieleria sp. TaxID=2795976 RepID=UPI00356383FB
MFRDYLQLPLPVRILCLGSLINRAGSFVLVFLSIYASEQLGFGVPFATACIGVLGLGSMAGSLLGGHLADKVGRRGVMLLALFGGAAILLLLSTVTNRWLFMLSVGVFALVADLYRPAAAAMIADLVSIDRRPHAFALMYISVNLGFAIAPPIGGLLAGYSFEWLFWIDAASMIAYGGIIALTIEETHQR